MSFCQKRSPTKTQKNRATKHKKKLDFAVVFRFGTLQNRGSRVGVVTISRNCYENDD